MNYNSNTWSDWYMTDGSTKDREIRQRMEASYTDTIAENQVFWTEADADMRFKAGDQEFMANYYGNVPAFRKKQFFFNRIRRICNLITGFQRRNRKSTVTIGVEQKDEEASDQFTQLLFWAANKGRLDDIVSDAFEMGSVTTGMALVETWLDHTYDAESGDLRYCIAPYNSFLIDPYFRQRDLSDCNFIWRRKWVSKQEAQRILPKRAEEIESLRASGPDGKFQFMAEAYQNLSQLLTMDEYWYRDSRRARFVVDVPNGLSVEWRGSKEDLDDYLRMFPQLATRDAVVPTVKKAICINGKTFYDGPEPLDIDRFPFVPFLGYYEPDLPYLQYRCQGVVRDIRDAQYLYTRRKIIELDMLESQVTSGVKYKPDALVNLEDVYMTGQGRGIAIKQEASMDDVQQIMPPQIPPSMMALSEQLGREIQEISGVNEELLGTADDDKAGILSMLRQGAGLTTLQKLFDNLDHAQKLLGQISLKVIQRNWSYGKVKRILGEEPLPQFKAKPHQRYFGDYDVRVEEGVNTTSQRQMAFLQYLKLREIGVPITDKTLVNAAVIQDKKQVIADMEEQQAQAAQMQQIQMQSQLALNEAQVRNYNAMEVANTGLGVERFSRREENQQLAVERRAQAIENISDARLNQARVIKELEGIEIDQVLKLLDIMQIIKAEVDAGEDLATAESTLSNNDMDSYPQEEPVMRY